MHLRKLPSENQIRGGELKWKKDRMGRGEEKYPQLRQRCAYPADPRGHPLVQSWGMAALQEVFMQRLEAAIEERSRKIKP